MVIIGFGFVGVLLVGVVVVKVYLVVWGVLFYVVNYLGGYLVVDVYEYGLLFECVVLLVFGGYIYLLYVCLFGELIIELGSIVDDVVGEVYDKVVWLLGLGYLGGKVFDDLVCIGDWDVIVFLCGMSGLVDDCYVFSFFGFKMVVVWYVESYVVDLGFCIVDIVVGF